MKKDKDLNYIVKLEKAIEKKYGIEAIENPKKYWDDEEEEYLDQLKALAEKESATEEKNEKVEVDGFFISKKLLIRKSDKRICPVCNAYSFKIKDDTYMKKFNCCYDCYLEWVVDREKRWEKGWRPNK